MQGEAAERFRREGFGQPAVPRSRGPARGQSRVEVEAFAMVGVVVASQPLHARSMEAFPPPATVGKARPSTGDASWVYKLYRHPHLCRR